jgi:hypothetical protein
VEWGGGDVQWSPTTKHLEDGGISINEEKAVAHSFDAAEVLRRARAIKWRDSALLEDLAWGARDHSDSTPRVCTFAWAPT